MNTTLPPPSKVARVKASHPRHPEPQDPPIVTGMDKAAALVVWVGGIFLSIATVAAGAALYNFFRG